MQFSSRDTLNMKTYLLLIFIAKFANCLTVDEAEASDGLDGKDPIFEDDSFALFCNITSQGPTDLPVQCTWTHMIDNQYDESGKPLEVVCSTVDAGTSICTNQGGNVDSDYANHIQLNASVSSCDAFVESADPRDNGRWECEVTDVNNKVESAFIDIFVSNRSTAFITEPDEQITYDIMDEDAVINATCRAYGGRPQPTFAWVMETTGEPNEIPQNDYNSTWKEGNDAVLGEYVEETLLWSPSLLDLCEINAAHEEFCDGNVASSQFSLVCKAQQDDYYESSADEISIKVKNPYVDATTTVAPYSSTATCLKLPGFYFAISILHLYK